MIASFQEQALLILVSLLLMLIFENENRRCCWIDMAIMLVVFFSGTYIMNDPMPVALMPIGSSSAELGL